MANPVTVVCAWCGSPTDKTVSEYNRNRRVGRRMFCSLSCTAKLNNAEVKGTGRSKSALGTYAREAYDGDWKCVDCDGPGTDVHHKDRDKTNNAQSNLVVLCRSCHTTRHNLAGDTGRGRTKQTQMTACV